jgi:hypothetical protein
MGYASRLSGELTITPPLKWSEYRDSAFRHGDGSLIKLKEAVAEYDTDEGQTTVRTANVVVPKWQDSVEAGNLVTDLIALVNAFPGHYFAGCIVRDGEDTGDVERFWIAANGHVKSEKALLRWPDGTDVNIP